MVYTLDGHAPIVQIFQLVKESRRLQSDNELKQTNLNSEAPEKEAPPSDPKPEKKDNPYPNEDLPQSPEEIPPFEKGNPEIPQELPPFKEDTPQTPPENPTAVKVLT